MSCTVNDWIAPLTDNRLASIAEAGGHTRSFTHDAAGNVTYDNRSVGGYGHSYNHAARMSGFSINGVQEAEYIYNARGQQVIRRLTQTGDEIHVIHDLAGNRIAEYDYDSVAGTSVLLRDYDPSTGRFIRADQGCGHRTGRRTHQLGTQRHLFRVRLVKLYLRSLRENRRDAAGRVMSIPPPRMGGGGLWAATGRAECVTVRRWGGIWPSGRRPEGPDGPRRPLRPARVNVRPCIFSVHAWCTDGARLVHAFFQGVGSG